MKISVILRSLELLIGKLDQTNLLTSIIIIIANGL